MFLQPSLPVQRQTNIPEIREIREIHEIHEIREIREICGRGMNSLVLRSG
jgi:hypothetical protein